MTGIMMDKVSPVQPVNGLDTGNAMKTKSQAVQFQVTFHQSVKKQENPNPERGDSRYLAGNKMEEVREKPEYDLTTDAYQARNERIKEGLAETKEEISVCDLKECLRSEIENVEEAICENLDVTEEDLLQAMETLGMTFADLLNPQKVVQLCLELQGTDSIELVTDGTFYEQVKTIVNTLQDSLKTLSEQFNLSLEDNSMEDLQTLFATDKEEIFSLEELNEKWKNDQKIEKEGNEQAKAVDIEIVDETMKKVEPKEQHEGHEHKDSKDAMNPFVSNQQNVSLHSNQANQVFSQAEGLSGFVSDETREVMDQMLDALKLKMNQEVKELDLMLHPESLGNVHVQLTSVKGTLSAQFTAQNEAVKQILEGQMIELKETLEQKGVQVEAIEVRVDTQTFEEQYSDQKKNDSEEAFEKEIKKMKTRNINLNDYMTEDMDMNEDEELTRKIMEENGNSLDYMV